MTRKIINVAANAIALPGRPTVCPVLAPDSKFSYPPPKGRSVYAAAHVAALGDGTIDWESMMGFREHLWARGLGVAEAAALQALDAGDVAGYDAAMGPTTALSRVIFEAGMRNCLQAST